MTRRTTVLTPCKFLLAATIFSIVQFSWMARIDYRLHLSYSQNDFFIFPFVRFSKVTNITLHFASEKDSTNPPSTIPVFYNLFVDPDNATDTPRVQELVTEQLSFLQPKELYSPIFVQSIGHPMTIPNTNTTLLGHHPSGSEMITLHSLWKYCTNHTDEMVLYLHSKGSYHNRHENDLLRRFLTFGAVKWNTRGETTSRLPEFCDVLSARFSHYPHPHTSGNMWMARCEYISKLLNPLEFEDKMEQVPRAPGLKQRFRYYLVGRKRFAAEHWVHSHPTVRPCDTYRGNFTCGYNNLPERLVAEDFESVESAPRFTHSFYHPLEELKPWTGFWHRWNEYKVLYNKTPTKSWWGWKFEEWRKDFEAQN